MPRARDTVSAADGAGFETLYRQHVQVVLRYALSRVRGEQAKDVVAETFLVAWRRLDEVPDEPTAWLLGVARKVIATQSRGEARRLALGARLALMADDCSADSDAGEQVADRLSVLAAFRDLSSPDQEILCLIAWDGLSREQASEVLGLTRLSFAVRLHRARRRFASRLQAEEAGEDPAPAPDPLPRPHPSHRHELLHSKEAH
jgi:RNA polymerase sigma-70 factor (ECF subfamily)